MRSSQVAKQNDILRGKKMARRKRREGFTLIELLVVMVILSLLGIIGVSQYNRYIIKSRISSTVTSANEAIKAFFNEKVNRERTDFSWYRDMPDADKENLLRELGFKGFSVFGGLATVGTVDNCGAVNGHTCLYIEYEVSPDEDPNSGEPIAVAIARAYNKKSGVGILDDTTNTFIPAVDCDPNITDAGSATDATDVTTANDKIGLQLSCAEADTNVNTNGFAIVRFYIW